ncbi:septation protein A [Flexibacterium corallicola]|uniref:septation protein A n=1 Tax=Flexibacterium corallicola TaxID=3037259 RepID=UPI00286F23C3|nr:septation protein A [Pseudovibrio sp. M1P-2-3]
MELEHAPNEKGHKEISPLLKLALELGPLLIFFAANSKGERIIEMFPALSVVGQPIFLATAAFMVAIVISLGVSYSLTRQLPIMPLVSGIIVLVFGGLTLYLQNDTFIKMKPTIVNALFGSILLGGLFFGRSLLGYVFDSAFKLDAKGWYKLTLRWGIFFFVLAIINEVVWRNFSSDFWVNFKVFGVMPITMVFTILQLPLIQKHSLSENN